jgi:hypothetical protein
MFCYVFGYKPSIAGHYDLEKEALNYIESCWDENYGKYLEEIKSNSA